jgi:soluble lytic murein transglycosylase-like protein
VGMLSVIVRKSPNRAARQTALAAVFGGCAAALCLVASSAASAGSAPAAPDPIQPPPVESPAAVKADARPLTDNSPSCNLASSPDPAEGEAIIRAIAKEESFPQDMLVSIARQESGFHMNYVSSAGAVGLMQLMPDTARRFQVDICDPKDNVRGAIRYLRVLQKRFDNPLYILAAYNAGEGVVEQSRGIPLYPETVHYVAAVLTDLYGWKPLRAPAAMAATPAAIEMQGGERKKPADRERNPPSETWSQGFVLHVE